MKKKPQPDRQDDLTNTLVTAADGNVYRVTMDGWSTRPCGRVDGTGPLVEIPRPFRLREAK